LELSSTQLGLHIEYFQGLITSRCSGKEPVLLPQTHGWTREDSFVSLSQSVNRPQIFVGHKLSLSRIAAWDGGRCGIDKWHTKELQRKLISKV